MSSFSVEQGELLSAFLFYGALLLIKLIAVSLLVTYRRVTLHVYANPEDCTAYGPTGGDKVKPNSNNELVERARRNHANDLENIPMFVLAAAMYICTGPSLATALTHFRIFVVARYMHTFAYQVLQVALIRSISHVVGMFVTISMVAQIVMATM